MTPPTSDTTGLGLDRLLTTIDTARGYAEYVPDENRGAGESERERFLSAMERVEDAAKMLAVSQEGDA